LNLVLTTCDDGYEALLKCYSPCSKFPDDDCCSLKLLVLFSAHKSLYAGQCGLLVLLDLGYNHHEIRISPMYYARSLSIP